MLSRNQRVPESLEFTVETRLPFFWLTAGPKRPVPVRPRQEGIVTVAGSTLKFKVPTEAKIAALLVEVSDFEPSSLLDDYEDVVETGFRCEAGVLGVLDWEETLIGEVPLLPAQNGDFRLRYLVRRELALLQAQGRVQIWPGTRAAPKILRAGSEWGRFWAGFGRREW